MTLNILSVWISEVLFAFLAPTVSSYLKALCQCCFHSWRASNFKWIKSYRLKCSGFICAERRTVRIYMRRRRIVMLSWVPSKISQWIRYTSYRIPWEIMRFDYSQTYWLFCLSSYSFLVYTAPFSTVVIILHNLFPSAVSHDILVHSSSFLSFRNIQLLFMNHYINTNIFTSISHEISNNSQCTIV